MKHFKKLSEEIIHQNPWWACKRDRFEKPNGETSEYYYAETRGLAMAIPVLPDDRLVLVQQYRYLEDKQSIEFPSGGIKNGQTALEAAKAELLEETGCAADELIKLGVFQPANGFTKDLCHVYLAYVKEQKEPQPDDTEEIEVIFRRPDEVDEMIRKNEIWDGETMAAWALAHHHFLHKS